MAVFDNLNYTTSSGVSVAVAGYWNAMLQEDPLPEMVHARDAQKTTLPLNNGSWAKFRKYTELAAITTPLAEGVTPAGQTLTATSFMVRVKPYGGHIELTDEIQYTLIDNEHRIAATRLRNQAIKSLDTITRNALMAGQNVQFIGSNTTRATIATTDVLTYAAIKKAVRTLERTDTPKFPDGTYHAIVHPDVVYDLTGDTMWTDVAKYQDKNKVDKYELGQIYGVKFFKSTNAMKFTTQTYLIGTTASMVISNSVEFNSTTKCFTLDVALTEAEARELTGQLVTVYDTTNTVYVPVVIERAVAGAEDVACLYFRWLPSSTYYDDWTTGKAATIHPAQQGNSCAVYPTLVYGQDAFGIVSLGGNGNAIESIIHPPGSSGAADPENQRATAAWKVKGFCAAVINEDRIVRIEGGATA